jgi:glycosyltransferase involved in cell wall biosynthesis
MRPLNVMHLTSSGGWGGREMYPLTLAAVQRERGHRTMVVAKRYTPLCRALAESDLDHRILRVGPYLDPLAAWALARLIRQFTPDVIHIHLSRDLALVQMALAFAGRAPAVILHKHIASAGNKRDLLHRYLYGHVDKVVAVSEFVRQSLLRSCPLGPDDVEVIFNGVDTRNFISAAELAPEERKRIRAELGADDSSVLVGVIGRLDPRKGQQWLIRAAGVLAGRGQELCYVLVGASEQDYRTELVALVDELGLGDTVKFTGHRTDSRQLYASLDMLIVPSFEEAFGLVAVEGMLSELPVVASNSGALPEFVSDGVNGLLVELNDERALAGAIEKLADQPELRFSLGTSSRQWALANLEMSFVLERLDELYRKCCLPV